MKSCLVGAGLRKWGLDLDGLLTFFPLVTWNTDTMAGTLAAIWDHEANLEMKATRRGWWGRNPDDYRVVMGLVTYVR